MYSFVPMGDIYNVHTGFYLVVSIVALIIVMSWAIIYGAECNIIWPIVITIAGIALSVYAYSASFAWNRPHSLNEPVVGKLVEFVPEVYSKHMGKRDVTHHELTVTYAVPDGQVTLEASYGHVYPPLVQLYKN